MHSRICWEFRPVRIVLQFTFYVDWPGDLRNLRSKTLSRSMNYTNQAPSSLDSLIAKSEQWGPKTSKTQKKPKNSKNSHMCAKIPICQERLIFKNIGKSLDSYLKWSTPMMIAHNLLVTRKPRLPEITCHQCEMSNLPPRHLRTLDCTYL